MKSHERRKMLEEVISNPVFDGVSVEYDLKKPFVVLREMAETKKWRARLDNFRTACMAMAA